MSTELKRISTAQQTFLRESENGFGYAAGWFARRFYYRYCHGRLKSGSAGGLSSNVPLSVVVPAAEKDADALGKCLAAANEMIRHPLKAKWVVGPQSARLRAIASEAGWEFISEDDLLPRPAAELKCRGWLLQQFIKFNAASRVPTENYLVLDADTVLLKPQIFFRDGKTILRYSDQYELLYNNSLKLVFGHGRRFPVSFVTHHMVMNKNTVKELLDLIARNFGCEWWRAILQEIDKGHLISFSEFETYGNHVVSQPGWKGKFALEHWSGLDSFAEELPQLPRIHTDSAGRLNSVSFHWHTQ